MLFERSTVIGATKIKLEYTEPDTGARKEISFDLQTMPEDIVNAIQYKTNLQPVNQEKDSEPESADSAQSDSADKQAGDESEKDVLQKIDELSKRAGLSDSPDPDFDN